ncbi:MAG: hypothetical protein NTW49_00815 [Bacteroidia bacterium]|nr:hypothetical protein [Bacteroidia bacterium]
MKFRIQLVLSFLMLFLPCILSATIEVVGSLRQVQTGNPGDTYKGQITMQNTGDSPQEVKIYQTDLQYNYEDQTYYEDPVSHNRSNANWIVFSPKNLIINANETQYINYEVTIPKIDSLKGTYWSVLMVEGVNPIDPNQPGKLNVNTIMRYAIQIVTELGNKGTGGLQFLEPTIVQDGDKLFLAVDIINTGDHFIAPEVSMELFDEKGVSVKKIEGGKKGLYPTTSTRFRINLEGLEGNKTYQTSIIAAGKDEDVFGIQYTLYF